MSAVDVAPMLDARGFAGRIVALSRRGRLPRRPAPSGGIAVGSRPGGGDTVERLVDRRVVTCTGPEGDLSRTGTDDPRE